MTERPIIFSAEMVRAILEGRKTQTRRIITPQPNIIYRLTDDKIQVVHLADSQFVVGRRLWVRETFSGPRCMEASEGRAAAPPSKWGRSSRIWYWADGNPQDGDWTRPRPSIHMPRWASRITLEVTDVRVERVQSITENDCFAEGVRIPVDAETKNLLVRLTGSKHLPTDYINDQNRQWLRIDGNGTFDQTDWVRAHFASLWDNVNGPGAWARNDWVWVVSFRRTTQDPANEPLHRTRERRARA